MRDHDGQEGGVDGLRGEHVFGGVEEDAGVRGRLDPTLAQQVPRVATRLVGPRHEGVFVKAAPGNHD